MPDYCNPTFTGHPDEAGVRGTLDKAEPRDHRRLAETRFNLWLEDDFDSQLTDPQRPLNLNVLGWSHKLLNHRITTTRTKIRKRIEIYRQVALEFNDCEMLSASNLEVLKATSLRTLECAKQGFIAHLARIFAAAGTVPVAAAKAMQDRAELTFDAKCVGVINVATANLAEEAAARRREPSRQTENTEQSAFPTRRDRKELNDDPGEISDKPIDDPTSPGDGAAFRKEGKLWALSFGEKTVRIPNLVGLGYIAELLRNPRVAIEATQLAGVSVDSSKLIPTPGIPLSSKAENRTVRDELRKMEAELTDLPQADWARTGELKPKIEQLKRYLREAENRRGDARRVSGTVQRARTSVTNALTRAIAKISLEDASLGKHLDKAIKTGNAPIYAPDELPNWRF